MARASPEQQSRGKAAAGLTNRVGDPCPTWLTNPVVHGDCALRSALHWGQDDGIRPCLWGPLWELCTRHSAESIPLRRLRRSTQPLVSESPATALPLDAAAMLSAPPRRGWSRQRIATGCTSCPTPVLRREDRLVQSAGPAPDDSNCQTGRRIGILKGQAARLGAEAATGHAGSGLPIAWRHRSVIGLC